MVITHGQSTARTQGKISHWCLWVTWLEKMSLLRASSCSSVPEKHIFFGCLKKHLCFGFDRGSHCMAKAALELMILPSSLPHTWIAGMYHSAWLRHFYWNVCHLSTNVTFSITSHVFCKWFLTPLSCMPLPLLSTLSMTWDPCHPERNSTFKVIEIHSTKLWLCILIYTMNMVWMSVQQRFMCQSLVSRLVLLGNRVS